MIDNKYQLWCEKATLDCDVVSELEKMKNDQEAKSEAFYRDLDFGTAGLRGIIGAGTNRMNIYTVGKASQGLAAYVNSIAENGSVAIAYDSRIKSDVFAKTAASVLAANGIKVYIFPELMPTPVLSYAVRKLGCDAGIVVTASHNPAKYNGYKVYDNSGCQLGPKAADYVLSIMNQIDIFSGVNRIDFESGIQNGKIEYISDDVVESFLQEVEKCRVSKEVDLSGLKVIYTPLHGTGNKPVRKILQRIGVTDVTVVREQELPDGNFPTCPYPNPEIKQPFECALSLAEQVNPDLLLATDPDCDRVGIAVNIEGEYRLFSGNEVGVLLLNYILSRRKQTGTLPQTPLAVKTIVSSDLCKEIAKDYGCRLVEVLTGFKFIGEQVTALEKIGKQDEYVFGFEESYGYLAGSHARDKDAVVGSMLICEMTAYYKLQGKNLLQVLSGLYEKYGYYYCTQKSFTLEGQAGMKKIAETMENIRADLPCVVAGIKVKSIKDIKTSVQTFIETKEERRIDLPKSNVIVFCLTDGSSLIVRPSGTEPKIKLYISAKADSDAQAAQKSRKIEEFGIKLLNL